MVIKYINEKFFITIIACLVAVYLEIVFGCFIREVGWVDQDVIDSFFLVGNVIVVIILCGYHNIPYRILCAMYVYAVISIGIVMIAYSNPDLFISLFKQWDSYTFYFGAKSILENTEFWYIDTYTKVLAWWYSYLGMSYRIGVGINILASLLSVMFLYKMLDLLKVPKNVIHIVTILFLILPWKWELSLFPLREAVPTCLLSISLYFYIKWFLYGSYMWACAAILIAIGAMMFHSGLIFVPIVYMLGIVGYDSFGGRLGIAYREIYKCMFVFFMAGCVCFMLSDAIFSKMPNVDFIFDNAAISQYSRRWIADDGGSTYLKWLSYDSLQDVLIQAPLRAIYFALAPVPWEWRGEQDMLSFLFGTGVHLCVYYYLFCNIKYVKNKYKYLIYILLMIHVLETLLYGSTTFNSGTAIRHRSKFEIFLFVIVSINIKYKMENKENIRKNVVDSMWRMH